MVEARTRHQQGPTGRPVEPYLSKGNND